MFEPTGRYWIFVVITLLLTAVIGYGTQATARLLKHWKPEENILLMPAENILRIMLVPILVGLALLSGLPLESFGLGGLMPFTALSTGLTGRLSGGLSGGLPGGLPGEFLIGLAAGLGIAILFAISTIWLHRRDVDQRIYSTTIIDAILPRSSREAVLVTLAMIPTVLLEELLFRSLLLGGLQPLAAPLMLLLVTSLLFGSLHSPQGTWGIVGATLAGAAFGGLFLWRGNLIVPFVAHYVANMVQIGIAARWYRK